MQQKAAGAGRPPGDVRFAVLGAYADLAERLGRVTWRDAAVAAGVPAHRANTVTKELVRGGLLVPHGTVPVPWSRRPMRAYRPVGASDAQCARADQALQGVLMRWLQA